MCIWWRVRGTSGAGKIPREHESRIMDDSGGGGEGNGRRLMVPENGAVTLFYYDAHLSPAVSSRRAVMTRERTGRDGHCARCACAGRSY